MKDDRDLLTDELHVLLTDGQLRLGDLTGDYGYFV